MRALLLGTLIAAGFASAAAAQSGPPGGFGRGPVFISPMGEPFRGGPDQPAPQDQWFDGADANHDGALSVAEMEADAARFFVTLDQRGDGEIDPDDVERYESVVAPEIRVGSMGGGGGGGGGERSRHGRGGPASEDGAGFGSGHGPGGGPRLGDRTRTMKRGAARFGYLDYPEPVVVADRNFNRGVDREEFRKAAETRFDMLDANGDGKIEKGELPRLSRGPGPRGGKDGGHDGRQDIPDGR